MTNSNYWSLLHHIHGRPGEEEDATTNRYPKLMLAIASKEHLTLPAAEYSSIPVYQPPSINSLSSDRQ